MSWVVFNMSFKHIVLKNLRQNIRHYGLYLFSLVLSIALYFSFVTLKYTHSINNAESTKIIQEGAKVGSVFLFIIIVVFLLYVNQLFIKQRVKELGLYQLIGLTRTNLVKMSMLEQAAIFIITGVIGIIGGLLGSRLLLLCLIKMMNVKVKIHLDFSVEALLSTILMLLVAYLLIIIQNALFIKRRSILMLMQTRQNPDSKQNKIRFREVFFGICGIIFIVIGYMLSLKTDLYAILFTPFIILFLTIFGAFLVFRSTVSMFFKTLKKRKKGNVSINDVIFTASIMHRMKKNAVSLTIIAVISAITVTVLCFSAITLKSTNEQILLTSPYDATFNHQDNLKKYQSLLNKHHIDYSQNEKEVLNLKNTKNNLYNGKNPELIGINIVNAKYVDGAHVKKGTAQYIQPYLTGTNFNSITNQSYIEVKNKNNKELMNLKVEEANYPSPFSRHTLLGNPFLVVNSNDYQKIIKHTTYKKEDIVKQYGVELKDHHQEKEAAKLLHQVNPKMVTKTEVSDAFHNYASIFLFVSGFLGIAFLIAAGCIVYIKQMDETTDEIDNFKILRKLGFTYQDMTKGMLLKVIFNFGLPLVVGLLHAYFASWAFLKIMGSSDHSPVFIVMGIYTLIYACFAVIAYIHMKRTIRQAI